jgi:tryptophan synthase beta chain
MIDVPKKFYNIQSVLEIPPPTGDNLKLLPSIFPKGFLGQEMCKEKFVSIPEEVRDVYRTYRPTPLVRAERLEKFLDLPNGIKIFYKREDVTPSGSHKINSALMQAYLAKQEGFKRIATETGAGQWGTALSIACKIFGLDCSVYMVRCSYNQKPYRKVLMRLFGAEIFSSPSKLTKFGRNVLKKMPNTSGSLGIAIGEALEDTIKHNDTVYALGSVLNCVLMHQTIIGMEVKDQLKEIGERPDSMIGCVGGGSNFAGFMLPFVENKMNGENIDFIAVEPKSCPTLTKADYKYDYGDTAKLTPLLKMFSLGYDFIPPAIHAGGLRYHGMAPIISALIKNGLIRAKAYDQIEVFKAGKLFSEIECLIPAPETCHAIKAAIDEALKAKKNNEKKTIVFIYSGHGLLDLKGYEDFLDGKLKTS